MQSYKKILIFFKKLNIHRGYTQNFINKSSTKSSNKFIFSYRNHKSSLNINQTLITLYATLKLIQLIKQKGSLIVVGNLENLSFVDSFKNIYLTDVIFIQKWVHGIISNWDGFRVILKNHYRAIKTPISISQKLRFFRFFFITFNYKKPNLVIVFQNDDFNSILKECFNKNIPLISVGSFYSNSTIVSYIIPSNTNNFLNFSLFFQLFLGQVALNTKQTSKQKTKQNANKKNI